MKASSESELLKIAKQDCYCDSKRNSLLTSSDNQNYNQNVENLVKNIEDYPHAFILACLMDRGYDYKKVWSIPYEISTIVGSFDIKELNKLTLKEYENIFNGSSTSGEKLHRYPSKMAKCFKSAVDMICTDSTIDGNAANLWNDKPQSIVFIQRMLQFKGCGFKIANMTANLLYRYFGIEFEDYKNFDIAPDVHTVRVFRRLGLTNDFGENEEAAKIYTIIKAREINPDFPGILDSVVWETGNEYCSKNNPNCKKCRFNTFCDYYKNNKGLL